MKKLILAAFLLGAAAVGVSQCEPIVQELERLWKERQQEQNSDEF